MQKIKSFVTAAVDHIFAPKNVFKAGFRKKADMAQLNEDMKAKAKHDRRYFCIEVHGKSLCLAKTPLFLFREDVHAMNEVRAWSVWIVEWRYFDHFIVWTIIANIGSMVHPASYDPSAADPLEKQAFHLANLACIIIFTAETCLKVIARGLICSDAPDACYLGDLSNCVDFGIVLLSLFEVLFMSGESKVVLVRFVRVLRPLRKMKNWVNMQIIVRALIESVPRLLKWILTVAFICTTFALCGESLFGTIYWNRCRLTAAPTVNSTGALWWPIDPDQPRFCGGRYACVPAADGKPTFCESIVSSKDGVLFGLDAFAELDNSPTTDYGYTGFQTFPNALFTVFQVATMEGWSEILYRFQDGFDSTLALVFIVALVIFSGLILLNLVLGVLWASFDAEIKDLQQRKRMGKDPYPEEVCSLVLVDLVTEVHKIEAKNKETSQRAMYDSGGGMGIIRSICFSIVTQPTFDLFMLAVIMINCSVLAVDSHPPSSDTVVAIKMKINELCTIFFTAEAGFKIFSLGFKFFDEYLNIADLTLVIAAMVELMAGGSGVVLALRVSRLLRIFKMMSQSVHVRVLLRVTQKASLLTANFALLVLILLFGCAIIALQLFYHEEDLDDPDQMQFSGFTWAFIIMFALLTGERWHTLLINRSRNSPDKGMVIFFFVSIFIMLHIILMNLFLGMFVAAFSSSREEVVDDYRQTLVHLKYHKSASGIIDKVASKPKLATSASMMSFVEDEDVEAPASPTFPVDVWLQQPAVPDPSRKTAYPKRGVTKTTAQDMNVLRMMQVKQSAGLRAERVVLVPLEEMRARMTDRTKASPPPPRKKKKKKKTVLPAITDVEIAGPTKLKALQDDPALGCMPPQAFETCSGELDVEAPPVPFPSYHPDQLHRQSPPSSARGLGSVPELPTLELAHHWSLPTQSNGQSSQRSRRFAGTHVIAPSAFKELYLLARMDASTETKELRFDASELDLRDVAPVRCDAGSLTLPQGSSSLHGVSGASGAGVKLKPGASEVLQGSALGGYAADVVPAAVVEPGSSEGVAQGHHEGVLPNREESDFSCKPDSEAPAWVSICIQPCGSHSMAPPLPPPAEEPPVPPVEEAPTHVVPKKKVPLMRLCCARICTSALFEPSVLGLILVSSFSLAVETPYMDPDSKAKQLLGIVEMIVSTAFLGEMVLKMLAFGFFSQDQSLGQKGYFRSSWNVLDFIIVSTSLIDIVMGMMSTGDSFLKLIRVLRLMRTLRPLRVITRNKGLKIIVEALICSVPTLVRTLAISFLFYIGFGILFMSMLKGELWRCSLDPTGFNRPDIVTRMDCEAFGGTWMNADSNFDHIGHSMATVLHMGTGEGWLDVLVDVVNSVGVDKQPRRNSRPLLGFLVLIFVWIASSFLVNLMIGVLTDQYQVTKDTVQGTELQSMIQRSWLGVQSRLFGNPDMLKPLWQVGGNFVQTRQNLCKYVDTKAFEAFIATCICLNTVVMIMQGPTLSKEMREFMDWTSFVFLVIFNMELVLKVFIFFTMYFTEAWNVFDCIIVVGSNTSFVATYFDDGKSSIVAVLESFRVLRVMRLIRVCSFLKNYCRTMLQLIPALLNVSLLLLLLLFIYACLGIGLFGTIAPGQIIGPDTNFHNFGSALLLVFRVSTGEDWQKIMYDTVSNREGCTTDAQSAEDLERDGPLGCGTPLGYFYFITFTSFVSIVLMNIIIAVILEGYQAMEEIESYEIYVQEIKMCAKVWLAVDVSGTGYLDLHSAAAVMTKVPQPIGFQGRAQKKVQHQLRYLPIYEGKVHFRDIVVLSAKRVYVWMNNLPEQYANEIKIDESFFGKWCSFFPDVPRPDRSIESFLVGHVLVKKYIDELILRRKRVRRAHLAEAYINEQIQDSLPLRSGLHSKLANLKPAMAAEAAGGRNAAGLFGADSGLSVSKQVLGPSAKQVQTGVPGIGPPPDAGVGIGPPPTILAVRSVGDEMWGGGQADLSMPAQEVGLVGSGFDFPHT